VCSGPVFTLRVHTGLIVVGGLLAACGRGYGVRHRIFTLRVKYSSPDTRREYPTQ
jgi:hypothetical protein